MADAAAGREAKHPIRVVARRTGITLHVLRAWERRYHVVQPTRTEGGQRLYSDADIERLKLLRVAVEAGRPISQVAALDDVELGKLVREDRPRRPEGSVVLASDSGAELARYLDAGLEAAERLDDESLHRLLMRALLSVRPSDFIDALVGPLLEHVGTRWQQGSLRPAQEHAVSIAVRRVLEFLLAAFEPGREAPTLVATTLTGDPHEFGAMMAGVAGGEAGWRVLYLGASLPAEEIARAAVMSGAAAVAVSAVEERDGERIIAELTRLRAELPRRVRLFAGGRAVQACAYSLTGIDGLEVVSLVGLRESLRRTPAAVGG